MKVVMVGPVYPFMSGISQYTTLMYQCLSEKHDVDVISYKMQYPKILFKREQYDYNDKALAIEGADYLVNTINPFNWYGVAKEIKRRKPDLVIFQWVHPYFAPCFGMLTRFLGTIKTLFICHNVFPHERFLGDRMLTKFALKKGNYFIVHAQSEAEDLNTIIPNSDYRLALHPTVSFFKQKNLSNEEARKMIHADREDDILLFFGVIREYKGLKHLLRAMPQIVKNNNRIKLYIAGEFEEDKDEYLELIEQSGCSDRIIVDGGHLPSSEVEKYFAACDLVVLPYESATQSGVIQVAYSFSKPVLATNVGGLPDVVNNMKTGYIVESKNSDAIAEAVDDYFSNCRYNDFKESIESEKYKYSWDRMRETIESFRR